MRFTCEHCGKRYLTNDVLLPGRVYRTRCKACGGLVTVRGTAETASSTGEAQPAGAPRTPPPTPSATVAPLTLSSPTPPPAPVARAAPPTISAAPVAAAPRAAAEPRYIDLFDGEGLGDAAPTPPPAPPRRAAAPSSTRAEPEPARGARVGAATVLTPREPDPFAAAIATTPPPPSMPAPPPPTATRAIVAQRPHAAARTDRRRIPVLATLAASGAVLSVLLVGAVWRPWMASKASASPALPTTVPTTRALEGAAAPPPPPAPRAFDGETADAPPPAAPPTAAAAAPSQEPPPRVAMVTPAPEPRSAVIERERQEQAERAGAAAAEKERSRAEKLELARAERQRTRAERAAEKAERARLAREEKERARAEKLEQARLARAEAAVPTRTARLEVAPPPQGLTPEAIQATLASGRKALEACFREHARGLVPPIEASQVTVHFLVQQGGMVTSPELSDEKVAATAAGQCLKTAVAALQFPAFKGEPARVDAPVTVPPPPAGGRLIAVEFTGPHSVRGGGDVGDTVYSERSNDAKIGERTFADGVLTYAGQVGLGEGSKYAGIGMNVNILPGAKGIDASRFKSMTIRLAATGTRSLRIRIIGADEATRNNGCYPVTNVRVSPEVKEYVLKFSDFDPENWCGSKGRSTAKTLKELAGFEVADANLERQPVTFSTGAIVLNP